MVSELFTITGSTNGTDTTGTISFTTDFVRGNFTSIRIPKGMKLKIWGIRISGDAAVIKVILKRGTTEKSVSVERFPGGTEKHIEKRRPIVIEGVTGDEEVRVDWEQSTAGYTAVEMEVELTDE